MTAVSTTSPTLREFLDQGRVTLTQVETAAVLGMHRQTVSEAIGRGEIPAVKYGRRVLVLAVPLARSLGVLPPEDGGGETPQPLRLATD